MGFEFAIRSASHASRDHEHTNARTHEYERTRAHTDTASTPVSRATLTTDERPTNEGSLIVRRMVQSAWVISYG